MASLRPGGPPPAGRSALHETGPAPAGRTRLVALFAAAAAAFALANAALFATALYRHMLAPDSSAGSFERNVAALDAWPADPRRDVLVVGDSRIFWGFDPQAADRAGGGLRFVKAAVSGTTPRCWPYLLRSIDPRADRFRAVVVPVDAYADDDSALGSLDGNDRPFDLRFIVFRVGLGDVATLARSFSSRQRGLRMAIDLLLRGPELRDDVQDLAADPVARYEALAAAGPPDPSDLVRPHFLRTTLRGVRVDFARETVTFPYYFLEGQREDVTRQILAPVHASPSYAAYRREWLGTIVHRYVAAGVPVIFVRIPTRPAHRTEPPAPSGTIVEFARAGAVVLPQKPYVALERPDLFADQDHLDRAGAQRFSALLGGDVARALRAKPFAR